MAQTERLYKLKAWLDAGRCLHRDTVLRELEVSFATLKRDLALLRDRFNAELAMDILRPVPEVEVLGRTACGMRRG